jgi:hypothetical protein
MLQKAFSYTRGSYRKDLKAFQMELFLPGLFVLLVSSIFIFLVVPRFGSVVLGIVSIFTLIAVILHHSSMFNSEYRLSTWQNTLGSYAPYVVLGFAILAILITAISMVTGTSSADIVKAPVEILQSSVQNAVSSMPSAASATNSITSNINKLINSTKSAVSTGAANTKSLIPALGYRASNV